MRGRAEGVAQPEGKKTLRLWFVLLRVRFGGPCQIYFSQWKINSGCQGPVPNLCFVERCKKNNYYLIPGCQLFLAPALICAAPFAILREDGKMAFVN